MNSNEVMAGQPCTSHPILHLNINVVKTAQSSDMSSEKLSPRGAQKMGKENG